MPDVPSDRGQCKGGGAGGGGRQDRTRQQAYTHTAHADHVFIPLSRGEEGSFFPAFPSSCGSGDVVILKRDDLR